MNAEHGEEKELLLLQIVNVVCLIFGTPLVASM